jgi:hypothetical protein
MNKVVEALKGNGSKVGIIAGNPMSVMRKKWSHHRDWTTAIIKNIKALTAGTLLRDIRYAFPDLP